jgi:hypothetical protein
MIKTKTSKSKFKQVERVISLVDLNKFRQKTLEKYGDKILPGLAPDEELTLDEKVARIGNEEITKILQEKAPEIKEPLNKEISIRRLRYYWSRYGWIPLYFLGGGLVAAITLLLGFTERRMWIIIILVFIIVELIRIRKKEKY